MQLNLLEWNEISSERYKEVVQSMRRHYWHIRNLRDGKWGQARLRYEYRKVEVLKRELLLAGYEKRHILDILACCRGKCSATKWPFFVCPHCSQGSKMPVSNSSGVWAARPMQAS